MDFEDFVKSRKNSATFATFAPPSDDWERPIPFTETQTMDFPVASLPVPVAAFVRCLAESTQTPEEMAGILSLGVLATAFQSRYKVEITPDWKEPLCLFCVAVAPPAERKSAVISALTRPIYEYETERRELEAVEIAQNQAERDLLERALEKAKNSAAKGDFSQKRAEILGLSAQLAEFKDRHPFRLLVDDATPEKLVDLMDAQGGCMTVCSAEGGVFDSMRGRYEKSINFDAYLKGHAGDMIVVDRIGRKSNNIQNPRLTMILTIQPEVLSGLMANATFRGRGLCGRFLYAMCRSKVGYRKVSPPPIPDDVQNDYRAFVHRILSGQRHGTIKLSVEADKLRENYQEYVEKKLGGEWENMRDWGGKLTGAMPRIAALIHASGSKDPAGQPVGADTVAAAINIAEFLSSHALAAYQAMSADIDFENAKRLWHRVERIADDKISKRDLFNASKGQFKCVQNMDPALRILEDMNYIRVRRQETGGRPSVIIFVNPRAKAAKAAKRIDAQP